MCKQAWCSWCHMPSKQHWPAKLSPSVKCSSLKSCRACRKSWPNPKILNGSQSERLLARWFGSDLAIKLSRRPGCRSLCVCVCLFYYIYLFFCCKHFSPVRATTLTDPWYFGGCCWELSFRVNMLLCENTTVFLRWLVPYCLEKAPWCNWHVFNKLY